MVDDVNGMPFPPTNAPTGYIFIPNCPNYMPLTRVGAPSEDIAWQRDIDRQIKAFKTGKDLDELRNEE